MILFKALHRLVSSSIDDIKRYFAAIRIWWKMGRKFVPDGVANERLKICETCPERVEDAGGLSRCGVCHCYITAEKGWERSFSKVYFPAEATGGCPLNKWP